MSARENDNLLRSWQEISAHLGCDVRTCHRWEKRHGMPVHRAEGGGEGKSSVFAYKDEIDKWFRETFRVADEGGRNGKNGKAPNGRRALRWAAWGAATLAVAAAAVFLVPWRVVERQPADFSIEDSVLIVRDKQKRELWRVDTGMEELLEDYYRANFQVRSHDQGNILPALVIKDIDNDGGVEVLFAPKRDTDQTGEGRLYCYDREGSRCSALVCWQYRTSC